MAKISIDVDEIKKGLRATALTAKAQFTEYAKKKQKDFSQKEVLKKIDHIVSVVKSQEFMKNPKVAELTKRVISISEQLEKTVSKNAAQLVDQVKAQVNAKLGKGDSAANAKSAEESSAPTAAKTAARKAAPKKASK